MNNQLEERLTQYLDYVDKGVDQLPLFVNEYLAWYTFTSVVLTIIGICGIFICIVLLYLIVKHTKDQDDIPMIFILFLIILMISVITTGINAFNYAKVQIAPRVIIADEIKSILKEVK